MTLRSWSKSPSLPRSWELWEVALESRADADVSTCSICQSVQAAGMSERVPFGKITRTRCTPRRR